jgi:hypothetical protein
MAPISGSLIIFRSLYVLPSFDTYPRRIPVVVVAVSWVWADMGGVEDSAGRSRNT